LTKKYRNKITMNKDELREVKNFIDSFPGSYYFTIESDSGRDLGDILKVTVTTSVHGHNNVSVTKVIIDENDW
jgi:hypothetical protein